MSKHTRVLRIVVASPGDVQAERDIVSRVANEVNRWSGPCLGLRLDVGRWETDTHPGFHLEGPQGLIDRTLLIEDSDLLIGIFWKRFGTPAEKGATGTEHEIRRACEAWKLNGRPQIMVYFNQTPYSPESKQETHQWGQVLEFRNAFPPEGLWWPYNGASDFERLLRSHLVNYIRDSFMFGKMQVMGPESTALEQLRLLPPAPGLLIGRDGDLRELKHRLGTTTDSRDRCPTLKLAVIRGWPGVGKSSAAAALAYDAEARRAFPDGILWVSLGLEPNLASVLATWGHALGSDELMKSHTVKDATVRLAALLRNKRMLLIVDDVWETAHAVPFQQASSSQCALLFTTRETRVAESIAPGDSDIYNLPPLTEDGALEVLSILAPSVTADYPEESRELARELECLPLALQVAGRTLRAEVKLAWGVEEMLLELQSGTGIIRREAPADRADLETQTIPTVAALFKQSTDRLDQPTRECFAYLGPFAPKPASFDLEALKAVWQLDDPRPVVRELVGRGLLEAVGSRFQMHALLVQHARALLAAD